MHLSLEVEIPLADVRALAVAGRQCDTSLDALLNRTEMMGGGKPREAAQRIDYVVDGKTKRRTLCVNLLRPV